MYQSLRYLKPNNDFAFIALFPWSLLLDFSVLFCFVFKKENKYFVFFSVLAFIIAIHSYFPSPISILAILIAAQFLSLPYLSSLATLIYLKNPIMFKELQNIRASNRLNGNNYFK